MADEETLYARFLSGELSPEEAEQLQKSGDREKIEKIIAMTDRFKMPDIDKKAGFQKLVTGKKNQSKDNVRKLTILKWVSGFAAAILIALSIYYFTANNMVEVNAPFANTTEHNFSDDSRVVLNAGAQITYDQKNWKNDRSVDLNGEAFFDVQSGSPFEVKTTFGSVLVLGTAFNVRAHTNGMAVECFEGKVRVSTDNIDQILNPQEGIDIRKTTTSEIYTIGKDGPDWRRGRSSFRNVPVQEVFRELERQYDIQVQSDVSDLNFQGSFNNNNLESAVNEIAQPLGLKTTIALDQKQVTFSR